MLTLMIDFNAQADGLVRGLQTGITGDGDPTMGAPVILSDGEGSEALGTLREIRDGLVFAEVDWDTYGPAGHIETALIDDNEGWQIEVVQRQLLAA
jgi:hypothetical protein